MQTSAPIRMSRPYGIAMVSPPLGPDGMAVDQQMCDRMNCSQYCPKPGFDPLWAAVIGAGVGGIVIGSAMYFVGKGRR